MDLTDNVVLAQSVVIPDFSGLPEYAQGILYTVLALGLALSVIIPRFGWLYGKEQKAAQANQPAQGMGVVAAVVDSTALNAHTAALIMVAESMEELTKEIREGSKQMEISREVAKAKGH